MLFFFGRKRRQKKKKEVFGRQKKSRSAWKEKFTPRTREDGGDLNYGHRDHKGGQGQTQRGIERRV